MNTKKISGSSLLSKTILAVLYFCLTASSCASLRNSFTTRADIRGLVYDERNQPVPGFEIIVADRFRAVSDINGRFVLQNIPPGTHSFTASVPDGPVTSGELMLRDKKEILYLRTESGRGRYSRIAECIEADDVKEALVLLESFRESEKQTRHWLLYQSIALWKEGLSAEALNQARSAAAGKSTVVLRTYIAWLESQNSFDQED